MGGFCMIGNNLNILFFDCKFMPSHISAKTRASVIINKLNNPDKSDRQIQRETPEIKSNRTITDYVNKDIKQNTQDYKQLIDDNNTIIKEANKLILEKIRDENSWVRVWELVAVKDNSFKQNQLLTWWATQNININIRDLSQKTPEELQQMLNELE